MASVTKIARTAKQPKGGYLKPSQFKIIQIEDGQTLYDEENIHGSILGMSVDYLTRLSLGSTPEEAFSISLEGAAVAEVFHVKNAEADANKLLAGITGLDDNSIINACKLVTFDVWLRDSYGAMMSKGAAETKPDAHTIHNIRVLVQRCTSVFEKYGPITKTEVTFEPENADEYDWDPYWASFFGKGTFGGYTGTVSSGDGDYLTKDTLWDVKVLRSKISSKHTLQLLMYWIMGQHSGQELFKDITKIGIFNPRSNSVYLLDINDIPADVIQIVEDDVICYRGRYVIRNEGVGITFDLEDCNGDIIARSGVYKTRATCMSGIKSFAKNASEAVIEDQTLYSYEKRKCPKFEIYREMDGKYCFRLKSKKGVIATGIGHKTIVSCKNTIERIRRNIDSPIADKSKKS